MVPAHNPSLAAPETHPRPARPPGPLPENRLLAALPPDEFAHLAARSEDVRLARGDVLARPGDRPDYLHFPRSGLLSQYAAMADGRVIEVGAVGREGFAGLPAALGGGHATELVVCQLAGVCRR